MSHSTSPLNPAFICVDWGTTSFRLWVLDCRGAVLAERRSGHGMSTLKPGDYEGVLEEVLLELKIANDLPVVICGMAGAAQGWQEAHYVDVPANLANIPMHGVRVTAAKRDVRILPGLANRDPQAPDVMRGEETLLLGAVLAHEIEGVICLPGTHSKWVWINDGNVTRFSTAMTGEVFALLAKNSTLSHFIESQHESLAERPAFSAAVSEALAAPQDILKLLFSVRAIPLLKGSESIADMPARLSGLLIGLELAGLKEQRVQKVTLISSGDLAKNYARALEVAAISVTQLNADDMGLAGLFHAAKALWPIVEEKNRI